MSTAPHSRRMKWVHKGPPKLDSVRNEINVTPLVDVCLVLLIIFMVVLPMLSRGKEVRLPQTHHHREPQDTRQPIVALDREGRIFVMKVMVKNLEEMKEKVQEEQKALVAQNNLMASSGADQDGLREGENRILVKAHDELEYGDVYPVIMALHEMGISNIDLGTNEIKQGQ